MPGRDGCICDECAEQAYLLSEEYLHKKKKECMAFVKTTNPQNPLIYNEFITS